MSGLGRKRRGFSRWGTAYPLSNIVVWKGATEALRKAFNFQCSDSRISHRTRPGESECSSEPMILIFVRFTSAIEFVFTTAP